MLRASEFWADLDLHKYQMGSGDPPTSGLRIPEYMQLLEEKKDWMFEFIPDGKSYVLTNSYFSIHRFYQFRTI